jgi:hypothetical protein
VNESRIKELRERANNPNDVFDPGDAADLLVEVERLRAALEKIAHGHEDDCKRKGWPKGECGCDDDQDIACQALDKADGKWDAIRTQWAKDAQERSERIAVRAHEALNDLPLTPWPQPTGVRADGTPRKGKRR